MTFIFEFSELDTETLRCLLRDCVGVDSYDSLAAQFFAQLSEQERRQRLAAAQLREECGQCPN